MTKRYLLTITVLLPSMLSAEPFSFVAYGDTAYKLPRDTPRLERLIDVINRERPAFAIHVGDFKGYSSCSDAAYARHKTMFDRHSHPVVLTPGDNDWTDCGADTAGSFDPLERLSALRRTFFAGSRSLGGETMPVARQSSAMPENARWTREGVVFATVHIVGPHNNLINDKRAALDSIERAAAGERWMKAAFEQARSTSAPALVLAFQIDPWVASAPVYESGPVDWVRRTIGEEASRFDGQVLVVHGDSHRLIVDTPYRRADIDAGSTTGMNVTRLQVPGWPDHRAVKVTIDPAALSPFSFNLLVPGDETSGAKP